MVSAKQIRESVLRYVSDNDADKFVRDIGALSHDVHKNGDAEAIELVNKILFKISALHGGLIARAAFNDALVEAVKENAYVAVSNVFTSSSMTSALSVGLRWEPAAASSVVPSACIQPA
jgi:hypothetical protein